MKQENSSNQEKGEETIKWKGKKAKVYGSIMKHKQSKDMRIIMGNINTLPCENNRHKLDLWKDIVSNNCDINIVVETNKDMRKVYENDKTFSLIKGWWKKKIMCRDEKREG